MTTGTPADGAGARDRVIRPLGRGDGALLLQATIHNLNWCGERFDEQAVLDDPRLRHYCEIVPARGDFGAVAEIDAPVDSSVGVGHGAVPVGVVWLLHLPASDPGYGFVAEGTPELSVCVLPGHRGRGIGTDLVMWGLREARRRGISAVSLSVETANPARRLYERCGFVPAGAGLDDGTLIARL
jgi:GNAT superfamily N-acetyltransferase